MCCASLARVGFFDFAKGVKATNLPAKFGEFDDGEIPEQ
jgi:hypothetical protein